MVRRSTLYDRGRRLEVDGAGGRGAALHFCSFHRGRLFLTEDSDDEGYGTEGGGGELEGVEGGVVGDDEDVGRVGAGLDTLDEGTLRGEEDVDLAPLEEEPVEWDAAAGDDVAGAVVGVHAGALDGDEEVGILEEGHDVAVARGGGGDGQIAGEGRRYGFGRDEGNTLGSGRGRLTDEVSRGFCRGRSGGSGRGGGGPDMDVGSKRPGGGAALGDPVGGVYGSAIGDTGGRWATLMDTGRSLAMGAEGPFGTTRLTAGGRWSAHGPSLQHLAPIRWLALQHLSPASEEPFGTDIVCSHDLIQEVRLWLDIFHVPPNIGLIYAQFLSKYRVFATCDSCYELPNPVVNCSDILHNFTI